MIEMRNHNIELLDIDLENGRLKSLKSKILKEVQKVTILKADIAAKTRALIKSIEKLLKLTLEKLDAIINSYLCILKQNKFTKLDLETIQNIEKTDLKVQIIDIENIKKQIDFDYSKEIIFYEAIDRQRNIKVDEKITKSENEKNKKEEEERLHSGGINSYVENYLKQKIDYFYNIVLKINWEDLNDCHEYCKELLVSNDGKYIFFCKLHLGI